MSMVVDRKKSATGDDVGTPWQLRHLRHRLMGWLSDREDRRYCPICRKSSRAFRSFGVPARDDAACPRCGSLERHRLIWLFFERIVGLPAAPRLSLLHIAPEPCLELRFRKLSNLDYLSADIDPVNVMVQMDITDIPAPQESFDIILCSHVLEHVPDDRRALAEFHRVLRPGGFAAINVPMHDDQTMEDPSITDPKERLQLFGQADHVRICGPDYAGRIAEAGFEVHSRSSLELVGREGCDRMGLWEEELLFHAVKGQGRA